jgi:hypothetical protein
MTPAGFELAIPADDLPQSHALDCAVTGIESVAFSNSVC